jgi:uncharacterized membrane protein YgdD (TMEM256/DUF423 family)
MLKPSAKPALAGIIMVLVLVLMMGAAGARAANTESGNLQPDMLKSVSTTAITYGSIYAAVLVAVQGARVIITALSPTAFLATAQTFGIPLFVVPVMAQLVPAVRQWAPQAVDGVGHYWSASTH